MKQIILLGDSVRLQYQGAVGGNLADIALVSGPEENGRWSGYTLNSLRFWLPQLPAPDLVVLPELCLTGYTCEDLFWQDALLDAAQQGLFDFAEKTADSFEEAIDACLAALEGQLEKRKNG